MDDRQLREVFAQRLKALRLSQELSTRELADRLGLPSHSTLVRYENQQRTPALHICKLIAEYFHVTVDWLAGIDDKGA